MSDFRHIPTVLHYALTVQPRRILDVGVGIGTYGLLLRQFLAMRGERLQPAEWDVRIEGVEIFEPYRNPVWDYAYDHIHLGDARELLPALGSYDLILMNDVLEHVERTEARLLVREALSHGRALIATTPNRMFRQGAWAGNDAEIHRSCLDASDFPSLVVETRVAVTTCFVCSDDAEITARLRAAVPFCPVARVPIGPRVRRRAIQLLPRVKRRMLREWRAIVSRLRGAKP